MLKGTRRSVTYGKPTRRYLLSESKGKDREVQLWREPVDLDVRNSHSPSPNPEPRTTQPNGDEFEVPSSDSDGINSRLGRPTKKRKLTPPSKTQTSLKLARDHETGKTAPAKLRRPLPQQERRSVAPDDYDVPSSSDEKPQSKRKPASTLTKRQNVKQQNSPVLDRSHRSKQSPSVQEQGPSTQNSLPSSDRGAGRVPAQPLPNSNRRHNYVTDKPQALSSDRATKGQTKSHAGKVSYGASRLASLESAAVTKATASSRSTMMRADDPQRPQTPPNDEESDDPLSSDTPKAQHPAALTPGILNIIELAVHDDSVSDVLASSDASAPTGRHSVDAQTPRRKLKDRLKHHSRSKDAEGSHSDTESPMIETSSTPLGAESSAAVKGLHSIQSATTPQTGSRSRPPESLVGRHKFTYGRQRSHISEAQVDDAAAWSVPLDDGLNQNPSRRLQLTDQPRSSSNLDMNHEGADDPELSSEKPLRNVHELRAAGEARRTVLMLDSIFDDIQAASSTGSARGAVFRLAAKLMDDTFPSEFVRHGSVSRLFALQGLKNDRFVTSIYVVALLQVLPIAPVAEFDGHDQVPRLIQLFLSLLDDNTPLVKAAKDRKSNMSRVHQVDLLDICNAASKRLAWPGVTSQQLTARLAGLKSLDLCIGRLRRAGYMHQLADTSTFERLSNILRPMPEKSMSSPYNGMESHLSLSILESLSIGDFMGQEHGAPNMLQAAISNITTSLLDTLSMSQTTADGKQSLALRLCLNITTKVSSSCRLFARSEVISAVTSMIHRGFQQTGEPAEADRRDIVIDNLVLGLGFLINLTEELRECRPSFLQPATSDISSLGLLLGIFQARHESAASATTEFETKVNVAFGYLAVLLCSLCLDSNIRQIVASDLQDRLLMKLREAMAQFVVFHRSIDLDIDDQSGGPTNPQTAFVERLEQVLSALNTACAT